MCDAEFDAPRGPDNFPCPRCGGLVWFELDPAGPIVRFDRGQVTRNGVDDKEAWAALHLSGTLIIDYRAVSHLFSAVLGRMVRVKQRLGRQARLKLLLHPDLYKVFQITRLDQIFDIERSG
jgi:hypothetical protein